MTTTELFNLLLAKESVTLQGTFNELEVVRKRLIKKKSREQTAVGEFADKSKRLKFEWLYLSDDAAKLKITLTSSSKELNVEIVDE